MGNGTMTNKNVDPETRAIIQENLRMLRGERVYFGETVTPESDPPRRTTIAEVGGDILDVLRAEASTAVGREMTRAELEQFADTF